MCVVWYAVRSTVCSSSSSFLLFRIVFFSIFFSVRTVQRLVMCTRCTLLCRRYIFRSFYLYISTSLPYVNYYGSSRLASSNDGWKTHEFEYTSFIRMTCSGMADPFHLGLAHTTRSHNFDDILKSYFNENRLRFMNRSISMSFTTSNSLTHIIYTSNALCSHDGSACDTHLSSSVSPIVSSLFLCKR